MSAFSYRYKATLLAGISLLMCLPVDAGEPKWLQISSSHFIVITDAGPKKGHEVAARFEQMRGVFSQLIMRQKIRMSQPIEILALRLSRYVFQSPRFGRHPRRGQRRYRKADWLGLSPNQAPAAGSNQSL